jgi:hypothetical protein
MRSAAEKFVRGPRQIATIGSLGKEDRRGPRQFFSAACGRKKPNAGCDKSAGPAKSTACRGKLIPPPPAAKKASVDCVDAACCFLYDYLSKGA